MAEMNDLQRMFGKWETPEQLDLWRGYGKRCASADEVRKAWLDGKDFGICGMAPYMSARDTASLRSCGVRSVVLWYGPRNCVEIELKPTAEEMERFMRHGRDVHAEALARQKKD